MEESRRDDNAYSIGCSFCSLGHRIRERLEGCNTGSPASPRRIPGESRLAFLNCRVRSAGTATATCYRPRRSSRCSTGFRFSAPFIQSDHVRPVNRPPRSAGSDDGQQRQTNAPDGRPADSDDNETRQLTLNSPKRISFGMPRRHREDSVVRSAGPLCVPPGRPSRSINAASNRAAWAPASITAATSNSSTSKDASPDLPPIATCRRTRIQCRQPKTPAESGERAPKTGVGLNRARIRDAAT